MAAEYSFFSIRALPLARNRAACCCGVRAQEKQEIKSIANTADLKVMQNGLTIPVPSILILRFRVVATGGPSPSTTVEVPSPTSVVADHISFSTIFWIATQRIVTNSADVHTDADQKGAIQRKQNCPVCHVTTTVTGNLEVKSSSAASPPVTASFWLRIGFIATCILLLFWRVWVD